MKSRVRQVAAQGRQQRDIVVNDQQGSHGRDNGKWELGNGNPKMMRKRGGRITCAFSSHFSRRVGPTPRALYSATGFARAWSDTTARFENRSSEFRVPSAALRSAERSRRSYRITSDPVQRLPAGGGLS
jgi:hypothetical protein